MNYIKTIFLLWAILTGTAACENFLDVKSDQSLVVPQKLSDLQAILDNVSLINGGCYPALAEMATDDLIYEPAAFDALSAFERDVYIWEGDAHYPQNQTNTNWKNPYTPVMMTNMVLEQVDNMVEESPQRAQQIKAAALFLRAFSFYQLAQVYCAPYQQGTENAGPGIPLRKSSDVGVVSFRSTVKETYETIINDLLWAKEYLPATSVHATSPNKLTAHALLARVYHSMGNYTDALEYTRKILKSGIVLMDYNSLDTNANIPINNQNAELIFFAHSFGSSMLNPSRASVSHDLISSYEQHDLRKKVLYRTENGRSVFKGGYHGITSNNFFVGLAFNEVLLIHAECLAREGLVGEALEILNDLRSQRFRTGYFTPYTLNGTQDIVDLVLLERRRELPFRGLRWTDLRRLNQDSRYARTLTRMMRIDDEDRVFELKPGDLRYTFMIPQDIITITNMQQNDR